MSRVVAAREAYTEAQKEARRIIERARLELGRSIHDAREESVSQDDIATELSLTREQVRRLQREYEKSAALTSAGGAAAQAIIAIVKRGGQVHGGEGDSFEVHFPGTDVIVLPDFAALISYADEAK